MSRLIIILTFCTTVIYGQTSKEVDTRYDWDYVIKYVKKNKMSAIKGPQEIVSEITRGYRGADPQIELIRFYKEAYDYKIIDKAILKKLVDSLIIYGTSEKVKSFAAESIRSVEYRLLNKKINQRVV